ncbi:MAG: cytochrome c [Solidesulfovibrio sp.]
MKRIGWVLFSVFLCGVAAVAMAAGDAAKGETLAKGCACHKSKGDLDGKDATALLKKMQAYKDGNGDNKAMVAIMKKQSDQDVADLAAYYASLPKK